ncbi:MAG TPA: methylaspartate mutase subunit E [Firmicutes bacterium]|nr:methylaspartate mutase subunit E [Bacillota bacterium]
MDVVVNERLDPEVFRMQRSEVLSSWPTGQEVDLEEAFEFHRSLPKSKVFTQKLRESEEKGITLVQPRAGVAVLEKHIELLTYLQDEGEADLLPTTIDSYTRQNRYDEAQEGLEESKRSGRSMLNGFPAVNYGVAACRRIVDALKVPVQVRHGTPDARLLAEITLGAGFTSFEGGGISYNVPYAKDVPISLSIAHWQYVDRLCGLYEEAGAPINREPFGPLTGTLVPPAISHAVGIIEALLAAEQGVKSITVGYGQLGNLIQDVAAVQTLRTLTREYLDRFGYGDVHLTTVFHQWMGGFPQDEARAFGVIAWGAAAAALSHATKVITKSPHEAIGIPTKEANAAGLRTSKQVIAMLRDQRLPESEELVTERDMIVRLTRAIIERTLEMGDGDIARGTVKAFEAGTIDVPFAPSRYNLGKVMPVRDDSGAVRFLDFGNLPVPSEVREFNDAALARRGKHEGRDPGFQMVVDDIYAIGKGMLVGRPRR